MNCPYERYDDKADIWRPCGKCIACRANQREEWSVRLVHEWKYWEKSMFVTLTYADKFLPDNCSLRKQDLSNFFHYVRSDERMKNREIKYFACGEYGDKGGYVENGRYKGLFINRPHYHAIIFGLDAFDDEDRKIISDNWDKCEKFIFSPRLGLHGEWLDGQAIDYVTPDDINYTCGYVMKKLFGNQLEEFLKTNREPVFGVQSNGLGKQYCLDNRKQLLDLLYVQRKGHILPLPRQYLKWLGFDSRTAAKDYYNARIERQKMKNIKMKDVKEIFNYQKILTKAIESCEKEYPLSEKIITSKQYYNAAKHHFYRALYKEMDRQAELMYKNEFLRGNL